MRQPTQAAGLQHECDDAEEVDIGIVDGELHKHCSGQSVQPGVIKEILKNSVGKSNIWGISILWRPLPPALDGTTFPV